MKQFPERVITGGMMGQGFRNLLGRPHLGPLPLVLREAVQNTWDARRRMQGGKLQFVIRVRNLVGSEEKAFRRLFDQNEAIEPPGKNSLARQLHRPAGIRVLELADYGTVGLSGATRPDLPSQGQESRFINFFFDFGRAHEEDKDAGTYGFGRSSLYTSGKASLILADSCVLDGRATQRRLMACRIGPSFEVGSWSKKGRYSGRHFWGQEKRGIVQPLIGQAAEDIAERLGLPARAGVSKTGTTVMIPWPVDDFNDGQEICRTLLYHLWPNSSSDHAARPLGNDSQFAPLCGCSDPKISRDFACNLEFPAQLKDKIRIPLRQCASIPDCRDDVAFNDHAPTIGSRSHRVGT